MRTLVFQENMKMEKSDRGYCVVTYHGEEKAFVFYPVDFIPDQNFYTKLEKYMLRSCARLLWIENPADVYLFWKCTCVVMPNGCIRIGQYSIYFIEELSQSEECIVYRGEFMRGDESFKVSDITLDLSNSLGAVSFSFSYEGEKNMFEALDAGLKFALPVEPEASEHNKRGFMSSIESRVLSYTGKELFSAHITPCTLLDPMKTYISLPQMTYQSFLTSPAGQRHTLKACDDAALVFETNAFSMAYNSESKHWEAGMKGYYLGLRGSFVTDTPRFMPGLYGNEFVKTEVITFVPHKNAVLETQEKPLTEDDITTSWISVSGSYHCTAQDAPLYGLEQEYFRAYPAMAASFSQSSPSFPVMLWSEAAFFRAEEAETAEEILYHTRFRLLTDPANAALHSDTSAEVTLITPSGLRVCADENTGKWTWIDVAHIMEQNQISDIRLYHLSDEARTAFLKKDCCIILPDAKTFSAFAQGEIMLSVDGWKMALSADQWHNHSLLIFKYNTSETLTDILEDNKALQAVLEHAYDENGHVRETYVSLMNALENVNFRGIIMLNACVFAGEIPDEIKMIAETLDPEKLTAPYVLIEDGGISLTNGTLHFKPSQVSGFISYADDEITSNDQNEDYIFKTVNMQILLKNSRIEEFSCKSELMPAILLGEKLYHPCCMVLLGSLEKSAGISVYCFRFAEPVKYSLPDSMVKDITVSDVTLSANGAIRVFRLSADIAFDAIEECDIFSYERLHISNIRLIMEEGKIRADYGQINIAENVQTRKDSFASIFGSHPIQYLTEQSSTSPDALNFTSITCPVRQGAQDQGWNGIIHRIPIGDSGGLGNGNILDFEIITAWRNKNPYIGMRMSGALERSFSVQGSIHLGFKSMELVCQEKRMFFILHNLTLKVFGLSLPQKSADLYLFGDNGKTGWYLGYDNQERIT